MRIDDGSVNSHPFYNDCQEGKATVCHATLLQSGFKHYVCSFKELLSTDLPSVLQLDKLPIFLPHYLQFLWFIEEE